MTIPSHILLGILIGGITGDYKTAISVSVLVDIDHLLSYVKNGALFNLKTLSKI